MLKICVCGNKVTWNEYFIYQGMIMQTAVKTIKIQEVVKKVICTIFI